MTPRRVLVVGLGSIGTRHARLIRQHLGHEVVALRSRHDQARNVLGIPEVYSWDDVDAQAFDVAVIATPTSLHIDSATRCAERGIHLFLEKPIDCRLAGLDDLLTLIRSRSLSTYVAYPLRFHPVVDALKRHLDGRRIFHAGMVCASYLPDWRPGRDHRTVHSSFRAKGGGVLLEMSHELDLAAYLCGTVLGITGVLGRVSELTHDADDCADLVLSHETNTTIVHLNLFSREARRWVEVDTDDGFLRADLRAARLTGVLAGQALDESFAVEPDTMYLRQLEFFFANLGLTDTMNDLAAASGLYRTMIGFREEQGYGSTDHDLRPRGLAGGQEEERPATAG